MSESLLSKVLRGDISIEEVQQWLSKNDIKAAKCGVTQLEFSRFMVEFLRKHTRLLLPVQEPAQTTETQSANTSKTETPNTSNDKHLLSFKSPDSTFNSPLSERSFPSLRSPLYLNTSDDRPRYSMSTSPHTPIDDRSYNSLKSEEKRSPIKINSTPSPKPLQLGDVMVIKRKTPKQKVKKRIQLTSPGSENAEMSGGENGDMISDPNVKIEPVKLYHLKEEHKCFIEKFALLYSSIISSNLVQDLLRELNYVMSLLTNDSHVDSVKYMCQCSDLNFPSLVSTNKDICLFKRSCEGSYFACVVLNNQWSLLKYLNKPTLSILSENDSVRVHAPELYKTMSSFLNESKSDSQNVNIVNREILADTVKFIFDTDSRPNYVNDQSFHAFKKQRDEFYTLLREWEESYTQLPSTEFFKAKYKRLRSILTISSAITNMSRLADLFVSQILASVFNENSETYDKLSLGGVPMTKFDMLNRRFVTPCSIVIGNEKRFPGVQEFFKDFLRSAENSFFYTHVQNALVHRIVSLNNFQFSCEVAVALQKQELFLMSINKLCLLAKFLSLITFLPYHDEYDLPLHFRLPLTEVRKEVQPPLDLNYYLTESMKTGRMILTIPWIVEFLNGIDNTSILLPYYTAIFAKLQYLLYKLKLPFTERLVHDGIFLVYSEDTKDDKNKNEKEIKTICATEVRNLIKQRNMEFNERFVEECVQTINCSQILITLYVNSLFNNVTPSTTFKSEDISALMGKPILISSEFYIGETALYQCCPQLHELKNLLEGGKKLSYKSVIPKMEKTFYEQENDPKAVDVLLEMHLFDNMPKSVRKCVDSVAEHIASVCVKSIRQEIIPSIKNEIAEEVKKFRDEQGITEKIIMNHMIAKFYSTLKSSVKKELSKYYTNIECSVRNLIKAEVPEESVINICIDIACRKCIEIVYNWIFNYINVDDIVKKNESIKVELARLKMTEAQLLNEKKSKKSKVDLQRAEFQEWISKRKVSTVADVPDPVTALHGLRHVIRMSLDEKEISSDEIIEVLEDCCKCIEYSPDLQFVAFRRVMMLSLDLCMILVFFNPEEINENMLGKFGALWSLQKICNLKLPFEQILSYRNMDYFYQYYNEGCVPMRKAMTEFLIFTINQDLLHVKRLFSQVLRLERREWPNELLIELSTCLKDVLKNTKSGHRKIEEAVHWIANFISEDDCFY